jgi:intracellular multiplication protein IcmB
MTALGNENPRDGDTAKRRAQAMKARLKELGHDIPLTHAYEMLATSCGFRNWPTMRATLSSSTSAAAYVDGSQPTSGRAAFYDDEGKPWEVPASKDWGFELIYSPPGKGKASFAQALDLHAVEKHLERSRSTLPRVTMIDVGGTSHVFIARVREMVSRKSRHLVKHVRLQADRTQSINVFDTPLGLRKPPEAQRQALATFLVCVLGLQTSDPRYQSFHDIAIAAVDDVYGRFAGLNPNSNPRLYKAGMSSELDREITALLPQTAKSGTWWSIVDGFFEAGHVEHAAMAQRFAVPKLGDMLPLLSGINSFDRDFVEALEYAISRHIHTFPILSEETDSAVGRTSILAVDISEFARGGRGPELDLAFLIARQAFAGSLFFPWSEQRAVPRLYAGHHARRWYAWENEATMGLLIYDDIHGMGSSASKQIEIDIRERKDRCSRLRLSTQGYMGFSKGMDDFVSRVFVLGAGRRDDRTLASTAGISPEWRDVCEQRLTGPTKDGLTFAVAEKHLGGSAPQFVKLAISPEGLWASVTNQDDILLREKLAEEIGLLPARNILGKRFPSGSAREVVELRLQGHRARGLPSVIVEEMRTHVIEKIAKEIASLSSS